MSAGPQDQRGAPADAGGPDGGTQVMMVLWLWWIRYILLYFRVDSLHTVAVFQGDEGECRGQRGSSPAGAERSHHVQMNSSLVENRTNFYRM